MFSKRHIEDIAAIGFAGLSAHEKFSLEVLAGVLECVKENGGVDEIMQKVQKAIEDGRNTKQFAKWKRKHDAQMASLGLD